jgi:tetratricopeptide (TPR) repeat protein
MSKPFSRPGVLSTAVVSALLFCATAQVFAQDQTEDRHARRGHKSDNADKKQEVLYPNATRTAPETKASAKLGPKLQKMLDAYNGDKAADARAIADEIIADPKANAYERAFSAQIAAQVVYGQDDANAAKAYLAQALELNGLDNNGHYQSMLMLGQLQMQDEQYKEALVTIDRFLTETQSQKPEDLILRGNILYRLQQYPEAITALKKAIDAAPEPKPEWVQLLMAAYFDSDQPAEAAKLAEGLLAKNPNDAKLQLNLASIYMQADQNDKAAAIFEKMRAAGQLTDEKDYHNLYALYLNMDGREKDGIAVIKEGLDKGILKPDFQNYQALGQAYYFSDQVAPAIEAYKKAAPLAPDGEAYLNLAKIQWQEGHIADAKQAAQQALDKGIKKPEEARKVLALKGK